MREEKKKRTATKWNMKKKINVLSNEDIIKENMAIIAKKLIAEQIEECAIRRE